MALTQVQGQMLGGSSNTTTTIQSNGTTAITIDSSQNVGIGTSSPTTKLDVNGVAQVGYTTSGQYVDVYNGDTTNYQRVRIRMSGTDGVIETRRSSGTVPNLIFGVDASERMRIDSSGNLLVGKTTTGIATAGAVIGGGTDVGYMSLARTSSTNSDITLQVYSTGASANRFYVGMGGTVYATSTSISAISDASLKENVKDLETGLTEVMALKPRRFDWKNGDATNVAGFIAQEVAEVLPELVSDYKYSDTETKKSLKMGDMLPTLVKAIQEQQAIITDLKARIETLEAK